MLAYADDIAIIWRTMRNVTAVFIAIEWESIKVGLAINEGKRKCMLSTSRGMRPILFQRTTNNYTFNIVKEFIYLGLIMSGDQVQDHFCQQVLLW